MTITIILNTDAPTFGDGYQAAAVRWILRQWLAQADRAGRVDDRTLTDVHGNAVGRVSVAE